MLIALHKNLRATPAVRANACVLARWRSGVKLGRLQHTWEQKSKPLSVADVSFTAVHRTSVKDVRHNDLHATIL